jgi:hypothetical protein
MEVLPHRFGTDTREVLQFQAGLEQAVKSLDTPL